MASLQSLRLQRELKVGMYSVRLNHTQPESWDELQIPADGGDRDVIAIAVFDSSYRANPELVHQVRRLTPWLGADACATEERGVHSPHRSAAMPWSWEDDDTDELWSDLLPIMSDAVQPLLRSSPVANRIASPGAASPAHGLPSPVWDSHVPADGHLRLSGKARQALSVDVADRLACAHDARAAARWGRRSTNADRARLLHRANAFYLDCLDADARCAAAWYGLGLVQRSLGEPVASLRALDMCLKLRPDGALDAGELAGAAWNARGRTLVRAGRPQSARDSFRRAVSAAKGPNSKRLFETNLQLVDDAVRAYAEAKCDARERREPDLSDSASRGVVHLPVSPDEGGDADDLAPGLGHCRHGSYVTAARRLVKEERDKRVKAEFAVYLEEFRNLVQTVDSETAAKPPRSAPVAVPLEDLGHELRRGAEHLHRSLAAHLKPAFQLAGKQRVGQVRLYVFYRRSVVGEVRDVAAGKTAAPEPGMMPNSGACAVAIRFGGVAETLCFVAMDLAANGAALLNERRRDTAAVSHRIDFAAPEEGVCGCGATTALRNRLVCAAVAQLKLADGRRGVGEQFAHVFVAGDLGYEPGTLEGEIAAHRAFSGFQASPQPQARGDAPVLRAVWRSAKSERKHLRGAAVDYGETAGGCTSMRFVAAVDLRPALRAAASTAKLRMPKLLVTDLHARQLPRTAHAGALRCYAILGVEPAQLLWTWLTPKLRSRVSVATAEADDAPSPSGNAPVARGPQALPRLRASWHEENFVLRLRYGADAPAEPAPAEAFRGVSALRRAASSLSLGQSKSAGVAAVAAQKPLRGSTSRQPDAAEDAMQLVVSLWATDSAHPDVLIGVSTVAFADLARAGDKLDFSTIVEHHGRAVAVLNGTLELLKPGTNSFRTTRRKTHPTGAAERMMPKLDSFKGLAAIAMLSGRRTQPMPRSALRAPRDRPAARSLGPRQLSRQLSGLSDVSAKSGKSSDSNNSTANDLLAGNDDDDAGWFMIAASDSKPPRDAMPWRHTWGERDFSWALPKHSGRLSRADANASRGTTPLMRSWEDRFSSAGNSLAALGRRWRRRKAADDDDDDDAALRPSLWHRRSL
ncbi:hypothetical protein M885DRAFT_504673 [Pelagophyceae sp. CCMP2097]|nr:hypothetical protein M885DRAFT_504673 [Pelagophyceae sp. CCMP2097]